MNNTLEKNIIQKQTIDLHYNGRGDVFALQQQFGDWYNEKLLPAIETVLDEFAFDDIYVRIGIVQIEASITDTGDWHTVLLQNIIDQFKDKINTAANNDTRQSGLVQHSSKNKNFGELLFYFLQYGYLPWWAGIRSKQEYYDRLEAWLQETQGVYSGDMLSLLNNQAVRKRVAYQFTDRAFALFTGGLLSVQPDKIATILKDISVTTAGISNVAAKVSGADFKEKVLQDFGTGVSEHILAGSIESWLRQAISSDALTIKNLLQIKFASKEFRIILDKIRNKDFAGMNEKGNKKKGGTVSDNELIAVVKKESTHAKIEALTGEQYKEATVAGKIENSQLTAGPENNGIPRVDIIKETTDISNFTNKIPEEGIYINNAGLVIVASFLPVFFERLSITENGIITNVDAAVCLTNFLATGNEVIAEFELVLPKILCGLSPGFIIDTNILFNAEWKEGAAGLLNSVIEYWSILKNTSVDGLRETFLQREGKLTCREDEWLLQVEQKQFDMLLGHLPWSIGMIKLPWMKQLLKTEWT